MLRKLFFIAGRPLRPAAPDCFCRFCARAFSYGNGRLSVPTSRHFLSHPRFIPTNLPNSRYAFFGRAGAWSVFGHSSLKTLKLIEHKRA